MRVIAGTAKSLPLKTLEGMDTRPTQDRIKETLFNMLQSDIPGCRFLDLFAGSGGIGIEAVSRGAKACVQVEMNPKAVQVIKSNMKTTHFEDRINLVQGDVFTVLPALARKEEVFDIIFMDPPYNHEIEKNVLDLLKSSPLADEYTTIIVEASLQTDMSYLEDFGYELIKDKRYKTNKHVFLRKAEK